MKLFIVAKGATISVIIQTLINFAVLVGNRNDTDNSQTDDNDTDWRRAGKDRSREYAYTLCLTRHILRPRHYQ